MGTFLLGAICGLVVGIIFSNPIWNWIRGTAKEVQNIADKNQTKTP